MGRRDGGGGLAQSDRCRGRGLGRGRAGAANGLVLNGVGPPDDVPCVGSMTMLFFGRIRDGLMLGRALKPAGVRLPSSVMDVLEVLTMTVLAWSIPRGDPALCVQVGIVRRVTC